MSAPSVATHQGNSLALTNARLCFVRRGQGRDYISFVAGRVAGGPFAYVCGMPPPPPQAPCTHTMFPPAVQTAVISLWRFPKQTFPCAHCSVFLLLLLQCSQRSSAHYIGGSWCDATSWTHLCVVLCHCLQENPIHPRDQATAMNHCNLPHCCCGCAVLPSTMHSGIAVMWLAAVLSGLDAPAQGGRVTQLQPPGSARGLRTFVAHSASCGHCTLWDVCIEFANLSTCRR